MIIGISGSSRAKGTNLMIETVLKATGKKFELISLKDKKINPCRNCCGCHKDFACKVKDDMQEIFKKLEKADALVLGSPTYFDNVSGIMKNFMDRCLPFYFSIKLENKKTVLITLANFGEYTEVGKNGKCKYHKEEMATARKCLIAMRNFSKLIGLKIIGSSYALHENPNYNKKQLLKLGNKLK